MKNILLCISSGIAAFKVKELIKNLKGFNIEVIMTENTTKLISPKEFEEVLGKKIHYKLFKKGFDYREVLKKRKIKHISLADKADIAVLIPATANTIGKIASGIADDLLTTTIMATKAPVLICPSMNSNMWQNPIVQENISKLKKLGYYFVWPEKGRLACGYEGVGRLANIGLIEKEIRNLLEKKLKNKKILVTAGATIEDIDPVRFISNRSSGKTGIYIAEEAAKQGANVTLIRGNTSIEPIGKFNDIKVRSAKEMYNAIKKNIKRFDIMIHSAAVSDFTFNKINQKIDSKKDLNLALERSIKILDNIKKLNKKIFLVGFKAEYKSKQLIEKAHRKLLQSNADLIVANDVGKANRGFDVDTNELFIIDKSKKIIHLKLENKRILARKILEIIGKYID